jgi:hypothetical protein
MEKKRYELFCEEEAQDTQVVQTTQEERRLR